MKKEDEALLAYKKGDKVNKICADLQINMNRLYQILKKHRIQLRNTK